MEQTTPATLEIVDANATVSGTFFVDKDSDGPCFSWGCLDSAEMFRNFHETVERVFGTSPKLNGVVFGKMQQYKPHN